MKPTTQAFDDAMLKGESLSRLIFFFNAFGVRAWGEESPHDLAEVEGDPRFADGSYDADGSVTAGAGLGVLLDNSARLMEIPPINNGNPDFSLEDFIDQTGGAVVTFEVSNEDGLCSVIEAEENIISAIVQFVVIAPGAVSWDDRLIVGEYRVEEFDLDRDMMVLQCKTF